MACVLSKTRSSMELLSRSGTPERYSLPPYLISSFLSFLNYGKSFVFHFTVEDVFFHVYSLASSFFLYPLGSLWSEYAVCSAPLMRPIWTSKGIFPTFSFFPLRSSSRPLVLSLSFPLLPSFVPSLIHLTGVSELFKTGQVVLGG